MLPLSVGRTNPSAPEETRNSLGWSRPANIAYRNGAELRALAAWLAIFVGSGVLIALGHVWLRLQAVDLGYRLSATRQVVEKLEREGHELTVEAATLDTPGRLEEVARTRLGMMRPEKGAQVILP